MDKRLSLKLNGNRKVTGVLRGFDQFMNVTLDETVEEVSATESNRIGMVVIRGNSIVQFECLERI
ncbi:Small nuclear ribonucleoprotein G [Phytophthora palmivora]|uniref:Small nuclear ribonucleoprotein G n=2 Tax=Peronosporomycetes TaxID=3418804 RepID=A0A2P4X6A8_9STRA|nr:Small nuclear ribonucleoprotein G [Phytophthora palmivora]